MQATPMLTISQVCDKLNISRDTLERLMKAGAISGAKIGKQWRFTEDSIQDYVKSRTLKTKKLSA